MPVTDQSVVWCAAADVSAIVCGKGEAGVDVELAANASARAYAEAVAEVTGDCSVSGTGYATGKAYAKAESTAKAWVVAYAKAIVSAEVCKKCKATAEFVGKAWADIALKAVAEAETEVEAMAKDGTAVSKSEVLVKAIQKQIIDAYVKILVKARAGKDGCSATIDTDIKAANSTIKCVIVGDGYSDNTVINAVAVAGVLPLSPVVPWYFGIAWALSTSLLYTNICLSVLCSVMVHFVGVL
jgi:hypothetical protein